MKKFLTLIMALSMGIALIFGCAEDTSGGPSGDDDNNNIRDDDDFAVGQLGDSCLMDDDCEYNLICLKGVCSAKQCEVDGECPSGQKCIGYQCIVDTTTDDDDVAPDDDDDNNDDVDPNCECTDNAECGPGYECVDCKCAKKSGCSDDSECAITPNTPRCNTASGLCVQCLTDSDCGGTLTCVANACQSGGSPGDDDDDDDNGGGGDGVCTAQEECCEVQQGLKLCLQAGSNCQSLDPNTNPQCGANNSCPAGRAPVGVQDQQGQEYCFCLTDCTNSGGGGGGSETPCSTSAECSPPTPVCDAFGSGVCVQCMGDLDCASGERCDTNTKKCTSGGGGGGGGDTCPVGTCTQVQGYWFCLENGQPPANAPMCDINNPSCPDPGQVPVQAQDQSGNPVCICLYECTGSGGGGGGGGGGGAMCSPCNSDADCGVDPTMGMPLVCTSGLMGNMCGTGDMMTDLLMCMMGGGGGGGFP